MADNEGTVLTPGIEVVDVNGQTVGRIRSVYPHYLAVDGGGEPPAAYRVPPHTFVALEGNKLRISVPITALDAMSPSADATEELPRHGGPLPTD